MAPQTTAVGMVCYCTHVEVVGHGTKTPRPKINWNAGRSKPSTAEACFLVGMDNRQQHPTTTKKKLRGGGKRKQRKEREREDRRKRERERERKGKNLTALTTPAMLVCKAGKHVGSKKKNKRRHKQLECDSTTQGLAKLTHSMYEA